MTSKKNQLSKDVARLNFSKGYEIIDKHPMFTELIRESRITHSEQANKSLPKAWAVVNNNGNIDVYSKRHGSKEEWAYVLAHCLLHLGFGHFQEKTNFYEWNAACNCFVAKFLDDLKLGCAPQEYNFGLNLSNRNEESL